MRRRLAYYAHDHGSGHLRNAAEVAAHGDLDVVVISGAPPGPLTTGFDFVHLVSDIVEGYSMPVDGPFHYVPTNAVNVKRRFVQFHEALAEFDPDVVLIDVSAEAAAFAKLCGYPTLVRRMPGTRTDRAHVNMYDLADGLIAYFPEAFEQPDFPPGSRSKTTYAGTPSSPTPVIKTEHVGNRVVVLTSLGGSGVETDVVELAATRSPDWHWTVMGKSSGDGEAANVEFLGVVEDPSTELAKADVVITSTGFNAVRTVAGIGVPLILTPEDRPFDEQRRFAESVSANSDAHLLTSWDQDWSELLSSVMRQDASVLSDALLVDRRAFDDSVSDAVDRAIRSGRQGRH